MAHKQHEPLDIKRIVEDFERAEGSSGHRRGTFKIDAPFEKALDTILKAKPQPKKSKANR